MKQVTKQIICIGGGGFGRNPKQRIIEKYILQQSNNKTPNVLFIPTASAEDKSYIVSFYSCFTGLNCNPNHINLFERTPRLEGVVNKADIIYVGGGNTKSMLAVWKEWNLDAILRKAYKNGIIMSGVSAGAICWFDKGITDSYAENLRILDCLGIIEGNACPHFDEEIDREPFVNSILEKGIIKSCICIEGNCALHILNERDFKSINFGLNKKSFLLVEENNKILKKLF